IWLSSDAGPIAAISMPLEERVEPHPSRRRKDEQTVPMNREDEIARRKTLVADRETDLERWSQRESLLPEWSRRAALGGQMVPAFARVLDIGCGAMDIERAL